jgi:hypothetical protein
MQPNHIFISVNKPVVYKFEYDTTGSCYSITNNPIMQTIALRFGEFLCIGTRFMITYSFILTHSQVQGLADIRGGTQVRHATCVQTPVRGQGRLGELWPCVLAQGHTVLEPGEGHGIAGGVYAVGSAGQI